MGKIQTKGPQNIPNGIKIHQTTLKVPNIHKIYQNIAVKDLENIPKLVFLACKYSIWQPCARERLAGKTSSSQRT
jgi:hypothetical protein